MYIWICCCIYFLDSNRCMLFLLLFSTLFLHFYHRYRCFTERLFPFILTVVRGWGYWIQLWISVLFLDIYSCGFLSLRRRRLLLVVWSILFQVFSRSILFLCLSTMVCPEICSTMLAVTRWDGCKLVRTSCICFRWRSVSDTSYLGDRNEEMWGCDFECL